MATHLRYLRILLTARDQRGSGREVTESIRDPLVRTGILGAFRFRGVRRA
jgi:hypothetical protein